MIRFIDLRGQDTGNRFMFWDTVLDQPVGIDQFAWNTLDELMRDAKADGWTDEYLGRVVSLCPEWTKTFDPAGENWTCDEGAPCVLCALDDPGPDHQGPCMSRNELMTELTGLP